MSKRQKYTLLGIVSVLGAYLVTIAVVHPFGNFPLNDDWAFASIVKNYVDTGVVQFTTWPKMTLLAQLLYSVLFVKVFGFSHVILRASTMVLGGLTLALFFMMLRMAGMSVGRAVLGTIVLLSNPFFLGSCFTFMTDIPYLFGVFLAVLLFARSCESDNWWLLLLASAAAGVATLVRQTGVLLPLSAAVIVVWNRDEWKSLILKAGVFGFFPAVSFAGFEIWMRYIHGLPPATWQVRRMAGPMLLLENAVEVPIVSVFYLGLLLLPITLPFGITWLKKHRTKRTVLAGILALMVLAVFCVVKGARGDWMPYQANTWFYQQTFGQGPYTLKDVSILAQTNAVACSDWIFSVVTILAVVLGGLLVALFCLGWHEMTKAPILVKFAVGAAFLHAGFFIFMDYYFDRHLLPVFPFVSLVMLFVLREISPKRGFVGVCALVLYVVTVAGVYHYHRWNEARWTAIDYLRGEVGASASEIDGGFEYNGWMFYDDYFPPPKEDKSWWWIWDDKYVISFSNISGYRILKRFPFRSVIPGVADEVLVLEREPQGRSRP